MIYEILLPWRAPLLTENQRYHWAKKARLVKELRDGAHQIARARKLPQGVDRAHIKLIWYPSVNRVRDHHNMTPTLKALVDGVVTDYGLCPGDDSAHVTTDCLIGAVMSVPKLVLLIEVT